MFLSGFFSNTKTEENLILIMIIFLSNYLCDVWLIYFWL